MIGRLVGISFTLLFGFSSAQANEDPDWMNELLGEKNHQIATPSLSYLSNGYAIGEDAAVYAQFADIAERQSYPINLRRKTAEDFRLDKSAFFESKVKALSKAVQDMDARLTTMPAEDRVKTAIAFELWCEKPFLHAYSMLIFYPLSPAPLFTHIALAMIGELRDKFLKGHLLKTKTGHTLFDLMDSVRRYVLIISREIWMTVEDAYLCQNNSDTWEKNALKALNQNIASVVERRTQSRAAPGPLDVPRWNHLHPLELKETAFARGAEVSETLETTIAELRKAGGNEYALRILSQIQKIHWLAQKAFSTDSILLEETYAEAKRAKAAACGK